jgi:hypothetical protein
MVDQNLLRILRLTRQSRKSLAVLIFCSLGHADTSRKSGNSQFLYLTGIRYGGQYSNSIDTVVLSSFNMHSWSELNSTRS